MTKDPSLRKNIKKEVRWTENNYNLIKKVSEARGETVGSFIRRSVKKELASLGYLTDEEKKALGINQENE
jgi:hypothetical protein